MDPSILLGQLQAWTKNLPSNVMEDDAIRRELRDAARNFSIATETPGDTIHRIANLPLQSAMARIGIEVDVFEILTKSGDVPLSTSVLAERANVDSVLMKRFLQYWAWASIKIVKEVREDQYCASNVSEAMVIPGLKAGINYFFETVSPTFMAIPKFMRDTKYRNPSDAVHCPWQLAHNTDQHPFQWLISHPDHFTWCGIWMTAQRVGLPSWLDVYPFYEQLYHGVTPETPLFVDVGGGAGHQCLAIKQRFPQLQGRVILQDLPQVLQHASPVEGVEMVAYDFWTTQPIKGARAYYMRNVMHDWPDDKCIQIFNNVMSAMNEDSVILIDEMIILSKDAHWRATQLDMAMITCLAALERSEKQWYALLEAAGLKILKIYTYTEELQDSIIVAVPSRVF